MASDGKYLKHSDSSRSSGRITPVHKHFNRSLSGSFGPSHVGPVHKPVSRSLSGNFGTKSLSRSASGNFGIITPPTKSLFRTNSSGSLSEVNLSASLSGSFRRSSWRYGSGRITPINSRSVSPALSGSMIDVWTTDGQTEITPDKLKHFEEKTAAKRLKDIDEDTMDRNVGTLQLGNGTVTNGYANQLPHTIVSTHIDGYPSPTQVNGYPSSIQTNGHAPASPIKSYPPSPSDSLTKIWPSHQQSDSKDIEQVANTSTVVCCAPEQKIWIVIVKLCCCVLAGIVFGWCMEKSRVFEPASIRLQMLFQRWIMLKMFLAAAASGQIVLSIISLLPWTRARFDRSLAEFGGCFKDKKGLLTSSLGPYILGTGMTLAGACPGMVLPQVGSWTKNTVFTLLGALVGALLYALVEKYVVKVTSPRKPFTKHTIHEKFGVPYASIAIPMTLLLTFIIILMEIFIPWQDDLEYYNRNDFDLDIRNTTAVNKNIFTMKSWPPSISGVIIGMLQVIIVFAVTDTLGGSSSYVTLVSQWVITDKLQKWFPYMARSRTGIGNWWQVFYACGAVLGGLFSSLASNSLASTKGPSIVTAIFGGILMLFGARLGAGCTSGHGLSGMGLLFWLSLVAVPCMFAGGIVTAFSMDATGALSDYHCQGQYKWMCTT